MIRSDVTLGPLPGDSAERMYRWMCDPEISGHLGLSTEPSLAKTQAWIDRTAGDPSICPHAILLNGHHIGNAILDCIDPRLSTARFSIYIGEPNARAHGVGSAATRLALQYAFRDLGLFKVWLTVHVENARAIHAYLHAGFVKEGLLRGEFVLGGRRLDVWRMGILAGEFTSL